MQARALATALAALGSLALRGDLRNAGATPQLDDYSA
jgi:hypothetical protein